MHDLNSENWLDARTEFCWMRARARAACRKPTRLLISRARWLLNARHVAKIDVLIVFLAAQMRSKMMRSIGIWRSS